MLLNKETILIDGIEWEKRTYEDKIQLIRFNKKYKMKIIMTFPNNPVS